ncbi:Pre-mRNA-splicing factor ATP-dependent RNA helicase [Trichinella spiralis]|uniref:Pre-mRNA-splicing factor ATP-dependent RNA helicase n=1 Tax=Trichinella spiralis TaxID=6334 RepID=A0ABR3KUP6_TRISP
MGIFVSQISQKRNVGMGLSRYAVITENNVYKCSSRLTVYSKLALVIAVLVNRLYTLWLWVSTAAICDSLVRETSRNFQSFLFSNCSQCVVIRRVSRSFVAICLITLPSWVTHAVLPDGTVENGPTPCYEVKPSAFGKMMDNLPLNVTHWSCLVLLNLFPCIALCIYAFRSCFLSHFKPRYFNLEGNQSRQHFNAYFLMNKWIFICPNIAYHLPLSVFAISAGFNVTAYSIITEQFNLLVLLNFYMLSCILPSLLCFVRFSEYRISLSEICSVLRVSVDYRRSQCNTYVLTPTNVVNP